MRKPKTPEDHRIIRERGEAMERMAKRVDAAKAALAVAAPATRTLETFLDRRQFLRELATTDRAREGLFEWDEIDSESVDVLELIVAIVGSVAPAEREPVLVQVVRSFELSRRLAPADAEIRWTYGMETPEGLAAGSRMPFVAVVLAYIEQYDDEASRLLIDAAHMLLVPGAQLDPGDDPDDDERPVTRH